MKRITAIFLAAAAVSACSGEEDKPPPRVPSTNTTTTTSTGTAGEGGGGGGTGGGGTGAQGGGGGAGGGTGGGGGMLPVSCDNGVKDGDETDVDCGGSCARCNDGQACGVAADCFSRRCEGGVCAPASCSNGTQDGDETAVDCGGASAHTGSNPLCPPCPDLSGCNVGPDCASQSCVNNHCLPPSCADGVQNGLETDVDCGGLCAPCGVGGSCVDGGDCAEQVCQGGVCLPPSCLDGVKNGMESDIDCGNACSTKCPPGQKCNANTDCSTASCNATTKTCACPSWMVIAPAIGGGSYCIDAYEVTKEEYDVFLQANPNLSGLPPICAGNIYQPSGGWPYTEGRVAVTYVDWCDAYAYCKYSGKHLCGKIGGGTNPPAAYADPTQSEWFNACTGQGVSDYPYGDAYNGQIYTGDTGPGGLHLKRVPPNPLPNFPGCEGGASGLYEMSANAAEWEDSCDASWQCRVRGGSVQSDEMGRRCDASVFRPALDNTDPLVGFRCCL